MRLPNSLLSLFVAVLALGTQATTAQDKPYREGTVWSVSFIKVKPGMLDMYLRDLAVARNSVMGEAKRQGLIVSEKILSGDAAGRDDWDVMLMVEYKNWAALDGLQDKFDTVALKMVGSEEKRMQLRIKRNDLREILGGKTLQEIIFK
jgi:hypothetical protein